MPSIQQLFYLLHTRTICAPSVLFFFIIKHSLFDSFGLLSQWCVRKGVDVIYIKNECECFIWGSKHRESNESTRLQVFGTPDETQSTSF